MEPISVIIPTYNRAHTIARAILSVLEQEYRPLEIIVVDDGSTDDTPEILSSFANDIVAIRQDNRGVSAARNRGIRASSSSLLAFCDSDDRWLPHKLKAQKDFLDSHPDVGVVTCGLRVIGEDGAVIAEDRGETFPEAAFSRQIFYRNLIPGPTSVLLRKEVLLRAGLFDETLRTVEDWDLWVRLGQITAFGIVRGIYIEKYQMDDRLTSDLDSMIECTLRFIDAHFPQDVRGLQAFLLRRRLTAEMYFVNGAEYDNKDENIFRSYLVRSLLTYPWPFFRPKRLVALLRTLIGSKNYRFLRRLLGRVSQPMDRWI